MKARIFGVVWPVLAAVLVALVWPHSKAVPEHFGAAVNQCPIASSCVPAVAIDAGTSGQLPVTRITGQLPTTQLSGSVGVGSGPGGIIATFQAPNPGDLAHLVMWLRADNVVSPTNSTKFSAWNDLVNGGATYTQSTSANQFVWNAADVSFGGQPSVTGAGAAFLVTSVVISAQPFTIYAVLNTSAASTNQIVTSDVSTNELTGLDVGYRYFSPSSVSGTVTTGAHAIAWVFNSTSSAIYVDSSSSAVGTSTVGTAPGAGVDLTLGYAAGSACLIGNAAEFLAYGDAHTSAQVGAAFTYFATRYAQTWH
jgi:hypothetical protein